MSDHCTACGQEKPPPRPALKLRVPRMERVRFERLGQITSIGRIGAKHGNTRMHWQGLALPDVVGGLRVYFTAHENGDGERPGPWYVAEGDGRCVEVEGEAVVIVEKDWIWLETSWNHSDP